MGGVRGMLRGQVFWVEVKDTTIVGDLIAPPMEGRLRVVMISKRVGGNTGATYSVSL